MGWDWNEEFMKTFTFRMKERKYAPWFVATTLANIIKYLDDNKDTMEEKTYECPPVLAPQ